MEKNKSVVLKGCAEGVNMILSPDAPLHQIIEEMRDIIKSSGSFFKGECTVIVSGRELLKADKLRISSVMNTIFPEAKLEFKEKQELPAPEIISKNHTERGARFLEELSKAAQMSKSYFKSSSSIRPNRPDARVYEGILKMGEVLECVGDVLVIGNVEKGAIVRATGSVYIMGTLSGTVKCEKGSVRAIYFESGTVEIGGISKTDITGDAQEAYIDGDIINIRYIK